MRPAGEGKDHDSMKTAIYPGSFDPVTLGHINIIKRAAAAFEKVIVCVMVNAAKDSGLFTPEERLELLKKSIHVDNVEFDINRAVSDYESEVQMAMINGKLNPDLDTVFFPSSEKYTYLSSSVVKELARYHADLTEFLPREILEDVKSKIAEKEKCR